MKLTVDFRIPFQGRDLSLKNILFLLCLPPLLVPLAAAQAKREEIKPSLECSCMSANKEKDPFDLDCQRITRGAEFVSGGKSSGLTSDNTFSCAYGPGGYGPLGGGWQAAEAPGFGVFLMSADEASWDDARSACARRGQLLAPMAGGRPEAQAALKAFGVDSRALLWVGVRYYEDVKGFFTTRGQSMVQMEWPKGQPNIREGNNCPALGGDGKLRGPYSCSGKRKFLCKA